MKTGLFLKFTACAVVILFLGSCGNGGNSGSDGNKSIEGHSDPANTGGTIGGSQSHSERMNANDSAKTDH